MPHYWSRPLHWVRRGGADGDELLLVVEELDDEELLHPAVARTTVERDRRDEAGSTEDPNHPPHCLSSAGGLIIQPAPTLLAISYFAAIRPAGGRDPRAGGPPASRSTSHSVRYRPRGAGRRYLYPGLLRTSAIITAFGLPGFPPR